MRRVLALVALLATAGLLAAGWLLGTASGARWVATRAVAAVPGLALDTVEGSLGGTLRVGALHWEDGQMRVAARGLSATLSLSALARGEAVLSGLVAEQVTVEVGSTPAPVPDGQATRAQRFDLPTLRIDDVRLARVRVELQAAAVELDHLHGRLLLDGPRIAVESLDLAGPDGRVAGALSLDLGRPFAIAAADLRFDVAVRQRRWAGEARLRPGAGGDALSATLRAPLAASLEGDVDPGWTRARLALRLPRQTGGPVGVDGALEADLRATLDDGRWMPRGTLAAGADTLSLDDGALRLAADHVAVEGLRIASTHHGSVRIDGRAPRGAGDWALRIDADDLRWPRDGAPPLRIAGGVAVDGAADAPRFRAAFDLAADDLPDGRLSGLIAWTGGGLRFESVRLDLPRGGATIDGALSFAAPALLEARIARFDPALFAPAWPGAVDARVRFDGTLARGVATGDLRIDAIGGTLRGRAIGGDARLRFVEGRWRDGSVALSAAAARLVATAGDAGRRIDARLEVPEIGDLWPDGAGAIDAQWRRDGGDLLRLRLRDVSASGARIAEGDAELALAPGADGPIAARIVGSGVGIGGQKLVRLSLAIEGTRGAHVAALQVDGGRMRGASARLAGGWRDGGWRGLVETFEGRAGAAGLRLREPAALRVSPDESAIGPACLDLTGGSLCLTARHAATGGDAQFALEGLSLGALREWLGDERVPALEGLASGDGMLRWDGTGLSQARATLSSPRGLARLPRRPDLDLGYRDLTLAAQFADGAGRVEGGARLVPEGRIDLVAELSRLGDRIGIAAVLDLRIADLSGIEAFTTTIAEPEGEVRGQLRLRGGALPPSISGALALTGFTAQVPAQALRLRDGVLVLAGVPGKLVLRGSVVSGDGTLTVDGRIDAGDPVPALLRIGGARVRVANTPNLSLLASPDLTLALRDGRWQLDGAVDIPRARIGASKLESSADRSPDVVVVDDPEPPDPQRPWRARVQVTLGDDVRLTGFGFDGTLAGALEVTQRQGAQALASGEVTLLGRYSAYGQRLDIRRGGLRWANSPVAEPTLDLRAERKVRGETVALEVRGSAASPISQVIAAPGTSDSEALALLVTGRPLNRAGAEDRARLSEASAALGAVGSQLLTRSLGGRLGLDEIGVSNDTRLDGEAFTLGKYLSPRLYVGYGIGILTRGEVFTVRYLVTDRIEIEANTGATQRAALNWRIER